MNLSAKLFGPRQTTLSYQEIEVRLGCLMRGFLRRRSTILAMAVARHIELLLAHPDFDSPTEQRCVYRRLERQWRYLAWCDTAVSTVKRETICFGDQSTSH